MLQGAGLIKCEPCVIGVFVLAGITVIIHRQQRFVVPEGTRPYQMTRVEWMTVRIASMMNVTDEDFVVRSSPHPNDPDELRVDVLPARDVDHEAMERAIDYATACCESWMRNHRWAWLRIDVKRTAIG